MDSTTRITPESANQGPVTFNRIIFDRYGNAVGHVAYETEDAAQNVLYGPNKNGDAYRQPPTYMSSELEANYLRNKKLEEEKAAVLEEARNSLNDRSHLSIQEQLNLLVKENRELKERIAEHERRLRPIGMNITELQEKLQKVNIAYGDLTYSFSKFSQRHDLASTMSNSQLNSINYRLTELERTAVKMGTPTEITEERKIDV